MSVSAQLAQGTTFHIAGTGGSAKTITGITPGYPTIITSVAHGLSNGDYGPIASITGTIGTDATNGLNGQSLSISNVTDDTFAVNVDTTGLAYTSGGTFTPASWTQIKEVMGVKPGGAAASIIDVTDLDSTAKESRTGLMDHGTLGLDINILESDAGQTACLAAFGASSSNQYKVVTTAKTRTFTASCSKWPTIPDSSVDGVQTGSAEFKISGSVAVS